jgi:predicted small lipoprotein YifL
MRASMAVIVAASLAALLAGCGQKGALYLPDKNGAVVTAPAESAPAQTAPPETTPGQTAPAEATPGQQPDPAQATPQKKPGEGDDSQPPQ